ncbi:hypothetical protein K2173_017335 [Erythroxylum novogranatense]|uniref:Protein kinase domain-containing protein n=1 Tax=Erythroxylum novogranatense TaxID=1862640 RepID=A0AAV8TK75_9ROSI|nr:hypothetical protein K2173_017335 [Erythroxylum novogranatense]
MAAVYRLILLTFLTLSIFNLSLSLTEEETLLQLRKSFTKPGALNDWVPGSNPCVKRWVGVVCFGGVITGLHLSGLGLSGTIDIGALQNLRSLRTISLVSNTFSGPIPEFNKLGALKSLLLSHNQFSGEIADNFFSSMSSLKKVWLSDNKFSGKIPESLLGLPNLVELHLEGNQFSGSIPPLRHPHLVHSLDFSNNKLEGQIPDSYSKFTAVSFGGNDGLCGKPLDKECVAVQQAPSSSTSTEQKSSKSSNSDHRGYAVGVAVLVLLVILIFWASCSSKRHNDGEFSVLEKENLNESMSARVDGSAKGPQEVSRRGAGSTRRGSHQRKNSIGELVMVNDEKGVFGLPDLMKAAAEVLGNGGLGSAYKTMLTTGLSVVVKRVREMNMYGRDMFDAEMRRFGRIRHKNILTPLAYHFRKEEKLLISEYMPKGSLVYVLHGDRGVSHAGLNWATRLKIIQGIANGLKFLYSEYESYNLPHGNLKSSNVLLNDDCEAKLSDYALEPLINPSHATQTMYAYKTPEYLQTQQVSSKSDVYCLGIIILEVITGKFPSQYLSKGKGGTDVVQWALQGISEQREQEFVDPELSSKSNTDSIHQMKQLLHIGVACAESDPMQRLDMKEAIRRIEGMQV